MKPLIVDNFLDNDAFIRLKEDVLYGIRWKYNESIDYAEDEDKFQFTHNFYKNGMEYAYYGIVSPILYKIRIKELYRIKANLLTRTQKIIPNTFHTDIGGNMGVLPYTTAIFYVNSNNGYTEFEDGTKIESIENRWISFPEDIKHRGTSCTDERVRVVINFNFLT
tara:strand:+ start:18 stop:512 length:495 start_codon:yes stop_codon:yes gene_type:complete